MADNEKDLDLDTLLKQQEKQDQERDALEQKIRQARSANATKNYDKVVDLLNANFRYFSTIQRNVIKKLIEPDEGKAANQPRDYMYQLDNGNAWRGHGKMKDGFGEWAESAEGKKWREANPGQKFPAYPNPKAEGKVYKPQPKQAQAAAPKAATQAAPAAKQ